MTAMPVRECSLVATYGTLTEYALVGRRRRIHLLALNYVLPQVDCAEGPQLRAIVFSRSGGFYTSRCGPITSCRSGADSAV